MTSTWPSSVLVVQASALQSRPQSPAQASSSSRRCPWWAATPWRAVGGINAAGPGSRQQGHQGQPELFYQDTMKGGKNLNDPSLVRTLANRPQNRRVAHQHGRRPR
jgi:aspartate oxidase